MNTCDYYNHAKTKAYVKGLKKCLQPCDCDPTTYMETRLNNLQYKLDRVVSQKKLTSLKRDSLARSNINPQILTCWKKETQTWRLVQICLNYQSQDFLRLSLHTPYKSLQEAFP